MTNIKFEFDLFPCENLTSQLFESIKIEETNFWNEWTKHVLSSSQQDPNICYSIYCKKSPKQALKMKIAQIETDFFIIPVCEDHFKESKIIIDLKRPVLLEKKESSSLKYNPIHKGSCHCKSVEFECKTTTSEITAINCNCSICLMKSNLHFIIPKENFKLLKGEENLSVYTFNTNQAKHTFCKICGVQAFYRPRSHPESYGINPRCLEQTTISKLKIIPFSGKNWEEQIQSLYDTNLE